MPYTENNMMDTKERLEDLRKEKKLSYEQLSKLLEEQGVTISHTNLKNYEINDPLHSLYNRTRGMSLENFVALADVFDVSVDYLLGRSKSKKAEYHQMSEELKLSDETIDLMKMVVEEDAEEACFGQRIRMLNALLLDCDMLTAFGLLRDACYAYDVYRATSSDNVLDRKLNDTELEAAEKYLVRYGLKAVNSAVIRDLYVHQALALIENVIRKFPTSFVEDYYRRLAENDWL